MTPTSDGFWTRRDLLKLGVLAPIAGALAPRWVEAATTPDIERNLALNRAAWASSSVDFIRTGHMATDGQPNTLWESAAGDLQWMYVDLGAVCDLRSVRLHWGKNHALQYTIQGSTDPGPSPETGRVENWASLHNANDGQGGVESIPLAPVRARYVRLLCSQRAKPGGYQLSAFEVYGTGGFVAVPNPSPKPGPDGALELSAGWRLINQAYTKDLATAISTLGYDASRWLIATVPGTILTSYQNLGAVPDMFYGDDQLQVSDFFAHTDWWYRTEIEIPENHRGKRTWLNFDGIHYRAFVYVNGKWAGKIEGAFIRGKFDITHLVTPGKNCCIAVLIQPVPKPDRVSTRTLDSGYTWPLKYPANEPTILPASSWDWLPTIRDRDTGIWNPVRLTATGDVTIENAWATTHFRDPRNLKRAEVTLRMEVKNHSDREIRGTLKARLGKVECSVPVTLHPGESRELTLDPSSHPQLSLQNPKLWWPSGYGEQNLYDLVLEFHSNGKVLDVNQSRVGIREFTYNTASLTEWDITKLQNNVDQFGTHIQNPLTVSCNGQPIFIRGVNWGMDEGMLRCDRQGFETRLRMEKEMHFNLIRNWAGNLDTPEFFDLCDEYGIMIWEEFGISEQIMPDDPGMWLTNARDRFLRRRNHACVALWCTANESLPDDPILTEMSALARTLDGTRQLLQCSTQIPPTSGDGPYTTNPPSFYFKTLAYGFRPELGSPAIPCVETMRRMMPHNRLWPLNDMWGIHDWWLGTQPGGPGVCVHTMAAIAKYGAPNGIEEFCRQAQMVNLEVFKAIYESWNDRMWNDCTGVMIWMSNPAWPSLVWNTYDYYKEPTGAYFGCRTACEPLHIQWNPVTQQVKVINTTLTDQKNLTAQAEIFNLDGSLFHKASAPTDCHANSVQSCLRLFESGASTDAGLSDVHFIRLVLKNSTGTILSRNFYWRGKTEWEYGTLRNMKECPIQAKAGTLDHNHLTVDLENPSSSIALMVRLKLVDPSTGLLVSPVLYFDNYVSLVPGESRQVDLRLPGRASKPSREAKLMIEGWNVKPSEVAKVKI